jgi:membrane fusion protein, multidrug efflux system
VLDAQVVAHRASAWLKSRQGRMAAIIAGTVLLVWLASWIWFRLSHSITDDAFIESDMVELAATVGGQIVEMLVEDSQPIKRGQLLCRIDPVPYRTEVERAQAELSVQESELAASQAALKRLEARVPQQIAFAQQQLAVAGSEQRSAGHQLSQTKETTQHDVNVAQQAVQAAEANLDFARVSLERWNALAADRSVSPEERDAKQAQYANAAAQFEQARVRLAQAKSNLVKAQMSAESADAARDRHRQAQAQLALAKQGTLDIEEAKLRIAANTRKVGAARTMLARRQADLGYTEVVSPFDGVVAKRFKFRGDYATPGVPIFTLYDTENLYVTANLEETKLQGVVPGAPVRISVDAFSGPFRGRVLWVGKATGAQFSLIPRDLSTGEFTKVIQRVPVRIAIDKDARWPELRPGLSVTVAISHRGASVAASEKRSEASPQP